MKIFFFIIFIIVILFTLLRMYEARVNTYCAYDSMVRIEACECRSRTGNKGIHIFFSISITFIYAVSSLMFNSGEFCDSAADDNRVKQK